MGFPRNYTIQRFSGVPLFMETPKYWGYNLQVMWNKSPEWDIYYTLFTLWPILRSSSPALQHLGLWKNVVNFGWIPAFVVPVFPRKLEYMGRWKRMIIVFWSPYILSPLRKGFDMGNQSRWEVGSPSALGLHLVWRMCHEFSLAKHPNILCTTGMNSYDDWPTDPWLQRD